MEQANYIVIIALAVFLLPLLADFLRIPAVVLEILFGVLVGPSALGLIQNSELIDLLADLGLFLLLFLAGFQIDFAKVRSQRWGVTGTALVIYVLTFSGALFSTYVLGYPAFMALVFCPTSVDLVIPTLRTTRRSATPLGQLILVSAILADFITMIAVALLALLRHHGLSWELLKFPALFITIVLVLRSLRLAVWWSPRSFERLFRSDDPDELGIRGSLALLLAFVGLSYALDIEPILGAFLAGIVFALVFRSRGHLEHRLSGFAFGFLIPIFFINAGMRLELEALLETQDLARAIGTLAAAFLIKMIPSFLVMLRGLCVREAVAVGMLLSARLSLIIAIATVGVELGFLTETHRSLAIVIAAVTITIAPAVFRALAPPLAASREPAPMRRKDDVRTLFCA